jgi:hexosaminidase
MYSARTLRFLRSVFAQPAFARNAYSKLNWSTAGTGMNLRNFLCAAIALAAMSIAGHAAPPAVRDNAPLPLIPMPAAVDRSPGYFTLRRGMPLILHTDNAQALGVARYFQELTQRTNSLHLDLRPHAAAADDAITFVLDPNFLVRGDDTGEGYELSVSPRRIRLIARSPRGLFYGAITLWQLITGTGAEAPLRIPAVAIADHPRFAWRGLLLDSARHFQSPAFIKHFIDTMAQHKLNVLHWHLTDDQGWRIEIKRYPRLTEVGAWRTPPGAAKDAPRYGGFYTQDEIRDIVRYAAERYVTIVPEIEMPGHAQAAIAAYPEFGVTGTNPGVSHDWGINTHLYNVDDSTFVFLQNVLSEIIDLFPSKYIHVGGDEAAKDQWQASAHVQQRMRDLGIKDEAALQGWFTARIGEFLAEHSRKLVGWDEILEGGLPADAVVMSWRGTQGASDASKQGHDVIMVPSPVMYFDHLQSSAHNEPPGRPDVVSLADVYAFEPVPRELDASQTRHVLGAEGALWSEYLTSQQRVEHAAFPRTAALAEVLWSPASRDWVGFQARLPAQLQRYRAQDVHYASEPAPTTASAEELDSDSLQPCTNSLPLRLEADSDGVRSGPIYRVDLMNPCWIYPHVNLDAPLHMMVHAGHIPYYFQLWHDDAKVVMRASTTGADELQLRLDDCAGPVAAATPLHADHLEIETIDVALPAASGVHDVCLSFATRARDPLWLIDYVRLIRGQIR